MALFGRVTIVGLGLIGGSLGMALKRRRLVSEVIGLSRSEATLRQAKRRGVIDWGTTDPRRAVEQSDIVILATPVETIVPLAKQLARFMPAGSILTDVGSVKSGIVRALESKLSRKIAFVGAHPLAGSEQRGIKAADARLFDGSTCIVTKTARTNLVALKRVVRFWKTLLPQVSVMSPKQHDRLLAAVSHLPHWIAFSLVNATEKSALAIAPRSFLDATRVAQSDPALWDDIFFSNRTALMRAMKQFDRHWQQLRTHLSRGNRATLLRLLMSAHARRHALQDRSR